MKIEVNGLTIETERDRPEKWDDSADNLNAEKDVHELDIPACTQ